jgi:hypothetical protein
MHQWWNNSHGKQSRLAFCGGGEAESFLSTLAEVDETSDMSIRILQWPTEQPKESPKLDHHGMCDSPPPSLLRVTSPSSLSTWSPEPISPIGWNDDECDSDCRYGHTPNSPRLVTSDLQGGPQQRPLAPSLFSPWLCVFDLDAACGGGSYADSVVDDSVASDTKASQSPPRSVLHPKQSPSSNKPLAVDWNNGRLPSMDLSVWFGNRNDTKRSPEPDTTAPTHDPSLAPKPIRPIPVYPSSRSSQYFSDFASNHGIEAIFLPVSSYTCISFHKHCRCILTFVLACTADGRYVY